MKESDFNDFMEYMEGLIARTLYEQHRIELQRLGYDAPADPLEAMRLLDAIVVEGKEPNLEKAKRMMEKHYGHQV